MTIVIFIAGLALILIGAMLLFAETAIRRESQKVIGEVVGFTSRLNTHKHGSTISYQAVARFRHLDGQMYYAVSLNGSSTPLNQMGDEIPVYVRKSDMSFAAVESTLNYYLAGFLAVLGSFFVIIFLTTFQANLILAIPSTIILLIIVARARGAVKKNPLVIFQWFKNKMKSKSNFAYSEADKDQIPWVSESDLEKAIQKAKRNAMIAVPILLLIGGVSLAYGMKLYKEKKQFLEIATHVEGTVIEIVSSKSSRKRTHAPIVEFAVPNSSEVQKFKDWYSTSQNTYNVGDKVDVVFDPSNPSRAEISSGLRNYSFSFILIGVGALFLFSAWYAHKSAQPKGGRRHGRRSPTQVL